MVLVMVTSFPQYQDLYRACSINGNGICCSNSAAVGIDFVEILRVWLMHCELNAPAYISFEMSNCAVDL